MVNKSNDHFGKAGMLRVVPIILKIKPYTLYMWKWWGFFDFKKYFHIFSIREPTFNFFYFVPSHDMQKQVILEKVVLWW